jgi:nicotinamide mononucleotide adenylyltransferase
MGTRGFTAFYRLREFLAADDELLVRLGAQAERYFADDPNTALIKLRQLAEVLAREAAARSGVYSGPDVPFVELLNALWARGVLTSEVTGWETLNARVARHFLERRDQSEFMRSRPVFALSPSGMA